MATQNPEHQITAANIQSIRGDLEDMRVSMSKMADALTKIAVLEEKHQVVSSTMLKIMEKQEKLDRDLQEIRFAQIEAASGTRELMHENREQMNLKLQEMRKETEDEIQEIRDQMLKQTTTINVVTRGIKIVWALIGTGVIYIVWQMIKMAAQQG